MTSIEGTTEAEVVSNLTKLAEGNVPAICFDTKDGRTFAVTRNDFKLDNITPKDKADVFKPKMIMANAQLQTVMSLIEYVNRFKNPNSMLFANIAHSTIVGAIDYHIAPLDGTTIAAEFGAHNATLGLPFSEEWKVWTTANEKLMRHTDFAAFLEENAIDVVTPAGADLLELCRDLQVKVDVNFSSSVRMGDTTAISYAKENDVASKSQISLPVSFTISIPVYFGEQPVTMTAWMRRKIDDGKLHLGFKINRLEATRQKEFARIVGEVEASTALATVYGIK